MLHLGEYARATMRKLPRLRPCLGGNLVVPKTLVMTLPPSWRVLKVFCQSLSLPTKMIETPVVYNFPSWLVPSPHSKSVDVFVTTFFVEVRSGNTRDGCAGNSESFILA
mmetsp:Transcript_114675/g.180532  ORF Transcript_114675/g.180532 Transcript_114675/m.180532 type:complete len:109 (-) Transcript_114675:82-408(-)